MARINFQDCGLNAAILSLILLDGMDGRMLSKRHQTLFYESILVVTEETWRVAFEVSNEQDVQNNLDQRNIHLQECAIQS